MADAHVLDVDDIGDVASRRGALLLVSIRRNADYRRTGEFELARPVDHARAARDAGDVVMRGIVDAHGYQIRGWPAEAVAGRLVARVRYDGRFLGADAEAAVSQPSDFHASRVANLPRMDEPPSCRLLGHRFRHRAGFARLSAGPPAAGG